MSLVVQRILLWIYWPKEGVQWLRVHRNCWPRGFTEAPMTRLNVWLPRYDSECHPGAICYEEGIEKVKAQLQVSELCKAFVSKRVEANDVGTLTQVPSYEGEPLCQYYCKETPNCCGFRYPSDCAACNASYGCHPGDRCYSLKRELWMKRGCRRYCC